MNPQELSTAPITALGLMSGTSLDGVDVVKLTTNGQSAGTPEGHFYWPYPTDLRQQLAHVAVADIPLNDLLTLENTLTEAYAAAILASGLLANVQLIGCHGQTIRHLPAQGLTWQLGNPSLLAQRLTEAGHAIPVAMDFRRRDMAAGGEGAPLAPLFHQAMLHAQSLPAALLNIGGVANASLALPGGTLLGTDCGPGMGLLDQFMQAHTGADFDANGALATSGTADAAVINRALAELPFFNRPFPKSADRYEFNAVLAWLTNHTPPDAAATLAALTVAGVGHTLHTLLPAGQTLSGLYLCGGGGHNQAVWQGLHAAGWPVRWSTDLGWAPQHIEAACFAWLAVRRWHGLPTSVPATTHARVATVGGVLTV
jgi:anhydro-N-acetylmuramic acid kinase